MRETALGGRIGTSAFAFRGYDLKNLGRTAELLDHPVFGPMVEQALRTAAEICAEAVGERVDLVAAVRRLRPSSLDTYAEDLAMIVAIQVVELQLLEEFFGIRTPSSQLMLGYSLGEVAALIAAGVYRMEDLLMPVLVHAPETAELGRDVSLGILFSRRAALDADAVQRQCVKVSHQRGGVIAASTYLSPNSILLLGQGNTLKQFRETMHEEFPPTVQLREKPGCWPPMHTSILRQRNVPNRVSVMLDTLAGGFTAPTPPILSCVTGAVSYNDYNSRELLVRFIDHPQHVWDVVRETLASGVETVIHVGPEPKIFPGTFLRVSNNVTSQLGGSFLRSIGWENVARFVQRTRPWLNAILPTEASLYRAPFVKHVILEDWLLEQQVE